MYNVSARYFDKPIYQIGNYLLNNYTVGDNFGYSGTHFDVGIIDGAPTDITWDGTHFWVVGHHTDEAYKFYPNGTYTGTHFDTGAYDYLAYGITWDGTYFWVTGAGWKDIHKYTAAGVQQQYIDKFYHIEIP